MGAHRKHWSCSSGHDPAVRPLESTKELVDYVKTFETLRNAFPGMLPDSDRSKPFLDRTIRDWGCIHAWYADVMLPFHTYVQPPIKGVVRMCYKYANRLTAFDTELTYIEGYAVSTKVSIPLVHAWCSDIKNQHVIDPTWRGQETTGSPAGYIGIPFSHKFVAHVMHETKQYGVLDSLWMLKKTISDWTMKDVLDTRWYVVDNSDEKVDKVA